MTPSGDLDTKLVDVSGVSLSALRGRRGPRLLDALRHVVGSVPLSDHDEIQEPGNLREMARSLHVR